MLLASAAIVLGLVLLVWSADRFVEGAAAAANHLSVPPLLIGMVVVGFGTSAPEMAVSALSALDGNPGLALGNAYGSNTFNIGLILGLTALIVPIAAHSQVVRKELPVLIAVTALAAVQIMDGEFSAWDAGVSLGVFGLLMAWTIRQGLSARADALAVEIEAELPAHDMSQGRAIMWIVVGLVVLVISSRLLVWGAIEIAKGFGVSDLLIGLTIVAAGTSLPELASSLVAARKGESDIALGNVVGSNLFNTLAVVGIAGAIHPMGVPAEVFSRDVPVMMVLTIGLWFMCFGRNGNGVINRFEASILLALYLAYTGWLIASAMG